MKEQEFSGMEFNPFEPFGETFMCKHFKRLGKIEAFSYLPAEYKEAGWKKNNIDRMLRFVVVFIDPQSPLFEERDFMKRRKLAKKVIGIKKDDVENAEIEDEAEVFQELTYEYFRLIHATNYEQWFTYKMQIADFNKYLRTPIEKSAQKVAQEVNARKSLMQQIGSFTEEMQKLENVIFNDDRLAKMINEKAVQNSIGGYAERFADEPEWH